MRSEKPRRGMTVPASVYVVWWGKVRTRLRIWRCTGREAVSEKIKASKRRIVHVQRLIGWVFSAVSNKRKKKNSR